MAERMNFWAQESAVWLFRSLFSLVVIAVTRASTTCAKERDVNRRPSPFLCCPAHRVTWFCKETMHEHIKVDGLALIIQNGLVFGGR